MRRASSLPVPVAPLAHEVLLLSPAAAPGRRVGVLAPTGRAGSGGSSDGWGRDPRELAREFWSCAARLCRLSSSRRSLTGCSSSLQQLLLGVGMEFSPRRGGRDPAGARTGRGGIRRRLHVSFGHAPRVVVVRPCRAARSRGALTPSPSRCTGGARGLGDARGGGPDGGGDEDGAAERAESRAGDRPGGAAADRAVARRMTRTGRRDRRRGPGDQTVAAARWWRGGPGGETDRATRRPTGWRGG